MINIDLNEIKSETEWYLYHYNQIKQLALRLPEHEPIKPIVVCGKTIDNPFGVINAIDSVLNSVDDLCRRIIIKRYFNNEFWRVTIVDEAISKHPYYRCVDKAIKLTTLQLVHKNIINV